MPGPVGGLRKHPHGRVDQLEDRYLGMVEAPSSNLGTSTRNDSEQVCWTCATTENISDTSVVGSARPPLYPFQKWLYPFQKWLYPFQKWLYPFQKWLYPLQKWLYPLQNGLPFPKNGFTLSKNGFTLSIDGTQNNI